MSQEVKSETNENTQNDKENSKPFIEVYDIFHIYKAGVETVALRGINFKIKEGEAVAIMGKSGVGKSTLLQCLGGVIRPTAGQIFVDNREITKFSEDELLDFKRNTVGLVYQSFNLADFLTVTENIALPMLIARKSKEEREGTVKNLLESLQIERYARSFPAQLSGGEQQRVAIAVALANSPNLLLADEPTGNLDVDTANIVYKLLIDKSKERGVTVVVATHDPLIEKYVDRIIRLDQ
ncbi:MAG: ABC transporter ATP-binding protein [Candidatus Heimdallarchaeota archaeon]|nr:ABC transporter ATP-binding protein [Candidatus Heimdallarchaeota archaeon]MCK5049300.1 ABC transporter ATP-binding protein [Candidatus Heimdallarchaeota archaeon]